MIGFLDAYFILTEADSLISYFSAIENGALGRARLSSRARRRAITSSRGSARTAAYWIFGSETSEAYEDVGDADNPFQPIKGSLFQIGTPAPGRSASASARFAGSAAAAAARRRSIASTATPARAFRRTRSKRNWRRDDARGCRSAHLEQDGHLFYALTCPSLGVAGDTPVFDETEGEWHHRRRWNAALGREEMWRARGHALVGQVHVVGSRDSGSIWALDLETYDNDGEILRARRRAPYLGQDNAWATIDAFELGVEQGVGLNSGQGSDPQVELLVSKDSAKTWFSAGTASLGPMGHYDDRTFWTRLGMARSIGSCSKRSSPIRSSGSSALARGCA
jgi:hypothetical protein